MSRSWGPALLALASALALSPRGTAAQSPPSERPVVVASKPFAESYLLAEIFAQQLESHGIAVERRPGLGATEIAFGALRTGAIDVYPEYTGTGLVAVLHEAPMVDRRAVFLRVATEFPRRYGVHWLAPLGFENTYAIAVRSETAERRGLRTLSDLAREAPELIAGFSPDFIGRADGLPGLGEAYGGVRFAAVRPLLQAVKYQALASHSVDLVDGYSTDGTIERDHLVVLEDDRDFFPAYEAAPLIGDRLRRDAPAAPAAVAALAELSGRLDVQRMRRLNRRVEADGEPIARVASDALVEIGLATRADAPPRATGGEHPSLTRYLIQRRGELAGLTLEHLLLVAVSLVLAIALAVPLALLLVRVGRGAESSIRGVGLLQTIPSIALLAFMIPLLGIGVVPAVVALFLYSLYPILRNTYVGVRDASPAAVDSARALGMTAGQILRHVRLPLAAPVIMAGIRTAAVIDVGTATLAAFIGAGGLGEPIVAGLALSDTQMILSGAIPAALLALVIDAGLGVGERMVTPRGVE